MEAGTTSVSESRTGVPLWCTLGLRSVVGGCADCRLEGFAKMHLTAKGQHQHLPQRFVMLRLHEALNSWNLNSCP